MQSLQLYFPSLGFLGAGNMAGALLRGTVAGEVLDANHVWACDVDPHRLDLLERDLGIHVTEQAGRMVNSVAAIVLAVKPRDVSDALVQIGPLITPDHLIISIAAGVRIETMAAALPKGTRIVRVMPNTPALVGMGAAGVAGGEHATRGDLEGTLALFRSVGEAWEVEEGQLDAVTALSGSGPAYVFRFLELMTEAGRELGLDATLAKDLSLQTFLGAARLAAQSGEDPAQLRHQVTSPGGTTAAALATFDEQGLGPAFKAGIKRAHERSIELANP